MEEFRTAIARARMSGEVDGVVALLAEDVVFRSPVVYAPYPGARGRRAAVTRGRARI